MKKRHVRWLWLMAATLGVTLLQSAGAFASYAPSFTVSSTAQGTTAITYQQSSSDDTAGMLTFYVPSDVFANVSQPGGLAVGTASATLAGSSTALTGSVAAAAGTDIVPGGTATFAQSTAGCNPGIPEAPAAFWLITLSGGGQTLQLPAFLFNVLETDPYGSFFISAISICPPPTPKLTQLALRVFQVFSVTPTWDLWHLAATPYTTGATTLNVAGKVEAESQDRTPHEVDASATKGKTPGTVIVTGKVKQGGVGLVGISVNVRAGASVVGSGKTVTGGRFTIVAKTGAKNVVALATVPDRKLAQCVQPLFAPAQCVSSTISGFVSKSPRAPVA